MTGAIRLTPALSGWRCSMCCEAPPRGCRSWWPWMTRNGVIQQVRPPSPSPLGDCSPSRSPSCSRSAPGPQIRWRPRSLPRCRKTAGSASRWPLSIGALGRLIRERSGVVHTRPLLVRIHEASHGNPFVALEMSRSLMRPGRSRQPVNRSRFPGGGPTGSGPPGRAQPVCAQRAPGSGDGVTADRGAGAARPGRGRRKRDRRGVPAGGRGRGRGPAASGASDVRLDRLRGRTARGTARRATGAGAGDRRSPRTSHPSRGDARWARSSRCPEMEAAARISLQRGAPAAAADLFERAAGMLDPAEGTPLRMEASSARLSAATRPVRRTSCARRWPMCPMVHSGRGCCWHSARSCTSRAQPMPSRSSSRPSSTRMAIRS